MSAETVRTTVAVPPAASDTELELRETVGEWWPVGDMLLDSWIVPVNPFRLVRVIVDVPGDPRLMVKDVGPDIVKLGGAVPGTVSGTGVGVPFVMVTQMPPFTLVLVQPVWKLMMVPDVVETTL